jgi:hypothetical protein
MVRLVRRLAAAIPTSTIEEIQGAGHAAPFDAVENFLQIISDVVGTSSPTSSSLKRRSSK